MKHIIHIFGASGSGTTTLGSAIHRELGFTHMDTDDYFWLPTDPKFTQKRPIGERLRLMQRDMDAADNAVISGSLVDWGDVLIPRFTLAIRVVTDTAVRIERLKAREYAHFGQRIREGGDMHQEHLNFLDWAARYDTGDVSMRSKTCHDAWQRLLRCPLLVVDGTEDISLLVRKVKEALYDHPSNDHR
ncbi:MAG: shikimate kinase [Clostridia bacterium]|nr:shikimate kinase [Clostridia bacterium]